MNINMNKPYIEVVTINDGKNKVSALVTNMPKEYPGSDIFGEEFAQPVADKEAKEVKKQYITWGASNRLPSDIIACANSNPYIAPSLKKLIDSTFSAGIKAYYVYYNYENGQMKRYQIEYEAAGEWLENKISEREEELNKQLTGAIYDEAKKSSFKTDKRLVRLRKDLEAWERSNEEWKKFQENNNLNLWLAEQASDANYFWNWFPVLKLNVGYPDQEWKPKIVGLSHLEAVYTRKGIANKRGIVTYCVYSHAFASDINNTEGSQEDAQKQVVIDALDPVCPVANLRDLVASQKNNKPRSRKLDYVLPMSIPTPGKYYYSFPSWWSLIKSGIYNYMMAMFARRAMTLENSTMFKYIIHLDEEYVIYECNRRKAETDEQKMKVFNDLISMISDFIKDPKNNGKTLISMSKTINGQKVKWVEIETIENPMKGSDVKEDIAEIANVMLFAMGIHPQTVGAIPGKDKIASGTEARELNTLQQIYLFPMKAMIMTPLYVIKAFNQWDSHLYFDIPVHVLTTLDKNKQGVEEMNNL